MSNVVNSANMTLPIPVVGSDPGPQYAVDVNSCLTIIDGHDHSSGSGVPVNPTGLDINTDLTFNGNNAISLRSVRFQTNGSLLSLASDIGCLYESGVDLYYNDGLGNQIRITQGGGITGTPGSISNLTPPASVNYVSGTQTFVFESAVNTPGNLDAGYIILRNNAANSFGLTLAPPLAMASDYQLTLPSLPATQSFMTLDAAGIMSAPWTVDGTTIVISSNQLTANTVVANGITATQIAANAVTTAKILDHNVTQVKLGPVNYTSSGSTGSGTYTSSNIFGSYHVVTPAISATITTTGRPVRIYLQGDGSTNSPDLNTSSGTGTLEFQIKRDGVVIVTAIPAPLQYFGFIEFVDLGLVAGTYVYTLESKSTGTLIVTFDWLQFVAQEY